MSTFSDEPFRPNKLILNKLKTKARVKKIELRPHISSGVGMCVCYARSALSQPPLSPSDFQCSGGLNAAAAADAMHLVPTFGAPRDAKSSKFRLMTRA